MFQSSLHFSRLNQMASSHAHNLTGLNPLHQPDMPRKRLRRDGKTRRPCRDEYLMLAQDLPAGPANDGEMCSYPDWIFDRMVDPDIAGDLGL